MTECAVGGIVSTTTKNVYSDIIAVCLTVSLKGLYFFPASLFFEIGSGTNPLEVGIYQGTKGTSLFANNMHEKRITTLEERPDVKLVKSSCLKPVY